MTAREGLKDLKNVNQTYWPVLTNEEGLSESCLRTKLQQLFAGARTRSRRATSKQKSRHTAGRMQLIGHLLFFDRRSSSSKGCKAQLVPSPTHHQLFASFKSERSPHRISNGRDVQECAIREPRRTIAVFRIFFLQSESVYHQRLMFVALKIISDCFTGSSLCRNLFRR